MPFDDPMIDGLSISALELRRQAALEFMSDGTAAGARPGLRPGDPGFTVSLAGSTINVSAGVAALYFTGQGLYEVYGPASSPGTVAAAHATLDRIDLVYLRIWDNTVDSSGLTKADTVYLQGTAASTPVAPTPAGTQIYIPLATIAVPHVGAGSPSVTDARPITVGPGGIGAGPLPASGSYVGQWWDDGTGLKRWSGSAWTTGQFGAQIAVSSTDVNQRPLQINAPSGLAAKFFSFNVGATEIAFLNAAGNLTLAGSLTVGGVGQTLFARKTVDESVTSSTTLQDDDQLTLSVAANAVYEVTGLLVYSADANADVKVGFVGPSGATMSWIIHALNSADTGTFSTTGIAIDRQAISATAFSLGGSVASSNAAVLTGTVRGLLITSGTAGTFKVQWSQRVSSTTASIMRADSYITLRRVA